ncbi:MAG: hypothetical protein ABI706_09395 [Ilumatobacteraceae bacterium]
MNSKSVGRAVDGIVAGDFNDPTNERLIYLSAAGLAIIGIGLLVLTIVWWRRGRQEHPALAPLEVMSARAWVRAPEGERKRRVEQARPTGTGVAAAGSIAAEPLDLEALVRSVPQAFDDLREPSAAIVLPAVADAADDEPAPDEAAPDALVEEPEPVIEQTAVGEESAKSEPAKVEASKVERAKVEAAKQADEPAPKVEPVDPDATSVSTVRPVEVVEASAWSPHEPSK